MTTETSNARGLVEYEYEVCRGDEWLAGGSTTDCASAQSEAGHYAMIFGQDGPVEMRIYEKRLISASTPPAAEGAQAGEVSAYDLAVLYDAAEILDRIGEGSAGLREASARIASALSQQPEAQGGGETIAGKFDRVVLNPMRVADKQQGQAVAEDMGGFTSDTAALAFLWLLGYGDPYVKRAVERLRSSLIALAQQPAATHEPCAAVAAIQFALTDPEGMTFLRLWNEGEFDTLRREWPDALRKIYVGADPFAAQHQESKPCKHYFVHDEDNGGNCCQLCDEVKS